MTIFFKDFSKLYNDLFCENYSNKQVLQVKFTTPAGVTYTSENERTVEGNKAHINGKFTAKYKHSSGFSVDKFQFKPDGSVYTELSLADVQPGLKLLFKGGDEQLTAEAGMEYSHSQFSASVNADLVDLSKFSGSVVAKLPVDGVLVGGTATLTTGECGGICYDGGVSYTHEKISVALTSDCGLAKFKLSSIYNGIDKTLIGIQGTCIPEKQSQCYLIGGQHKLNDSITIKGKVDCCGNVGSVVSWKCCEGVVAHGSLSTLVSDVAQFKFGFNINLG